MTINHQKRRRLTWVAIVIASLAAGAIIAYAVMSFFAKPEPPQVTQAKPTPASKKIPHLEVAAMGDMLAHDSVVSNAQENEGYDFTKYFSKIMPALDNKDVIFCNPETPVAGDTLGVSGYPTFNAPKKFAQDLSGGVGCNVINLATNHIYDKGSAGVRDSISIWNELKPLAFGGANTTEKEQKTVRYFTKNGIKAAFVALADFSNVKNFAPHEINLYHDKALVQQLMSDARQNADVVIVSAHWGVEDSTTVSDQQVSTAKLLSELGADVIIGTGPHVLQKVETITTGGQKTLVWYSIGNMLSSQLEINQLTGGIALFTIKKDNGRVSIENPRLAPTFMSYAWPDEAKKRQDLSARNNLMIYPLKDSDSYIKQLFPDKSLSERSAYVEQTLGESVTIITQ